MPEIGETRTAAEMVPPRKGHGSYVWTKCKRCPNERWLAKPNRDPDGCAACHQRDWGKKFQIDPTREPTRELDNPS